MFTMSIIYFPVNSSNIAVVCIWVYAILWKTILEFDIIYTVYFCLTYTYKIKITIIIFYFFFYEVIK